MLLQGALGVALGVALAMALLGEALAMELLERRTVLTPPHPIGFMSLLP